MVIVAAIKNLFYFFQKVEQSNADYHEDFMAMLKVIEEYGGACSMTHFHNMLKRELKAGGTDMSKATNKQMREGKKENQFYFFQKVEQSNADYHEDFMAMLKVIKEYGGAGLMTHFPNMLKRELEADGTDMSKATNKQMMEGKKAVCEKFFAALMLSGANGAKYNDLK